MGFYLQVEVASSLSPDKFRERVIVPLKSALEREKLGHIVDKDPEDDLGTEGHYELVLKVTDQERAKVVVEAVLRSVDG